MLDIVSLSSADFVTCKMSAKETLNQGVGSKKLKTKQLLKINQLVSLHPTEGDKGWPAKKHHKLKYFIKKFSSNQNYLK